MVVRKILETTLAAGSTSVTFTDSEIPYSLLRVYASNPDILPTERVLSGNTVTVRYEAQTTSMGVALEIVKAGLEVIDSLTSTDDTAALSAKQGKVLKDALDALSVPDLSDLGDVTITSATDGQVLTYNDGVWINYTPVTALSGLTDVTITSATDGQVLIYDDGEWINGAQASGGLNYSTSEQDTGLKWTDGKSIYQKTFELASGTISSGSLAVATQTGVDTVINSECTCNQTNNSRKYALPMIRTVATECIYKSVYVDNGTLNMQILSGTVYILDTIKFTAWYTKA